MATGRYTADPPKASRPEYLQVNVYRIQGRWMCDLRIMRPGGAAKRTVRQVQTFQVRCEEDGLREAVLAAGRELLVMWGDAP
jgi:hypothetical protein